MESFSLDICTYHIKKFQVDIFLILKCKNFFQLKNKKMGILREKDISEFCKDISSRPDHRLFSETPCTSIQLSIKKDFKI